MKMQFPLLALLSLFSHLFTNAQSNSTIPDTDVQSITHINKQYGEAFIKNDSAMFLDCYAPDACIMAPNTPILCGEKRWLLFYKAAYGTGMRNIIFTTISWYGYTGEYVTEQGAYQQLDANGTPLGTGKYLVVWQKLPKGWRMLRDMFNPDKRQ